MYVLILFFRGTRYTVDTAKHASLGSNVFFKMYFLFKKSRNFMRLLVFQLHCDSSVLSDLLRAMHIYFFYFAQSNSFKTLPWSGSEPVLV